MLVPDFQAAQLPAPRNGSHDPNWLLGSCESRPAFLLGGAGGLVDSPGLRVANGQVVIGSNWTLRALVPSVWHVVDLNVWKSEREQLARCPDSMVVVANKAIFGGGPYSVAGANTLRTVGKKRWPITEISVQKIAGASRSKSDGVVRPNYTPPFLPSSFSEPYHPGGNSACYMVQTAHLMGCSQIYLLGFSLQSGTGYFFGLENPVTRRRSFYSDPDRAIEWLAWYNKQYPGRAKLWPGWDGPIYDVLEKVDEDEARELTRSQPPFRHERNEGGRSDEAVQRLRPDRADGPLLPDVPQSRQAASVRQQGAVEGQGGQRLGRVQRKPEQGKVIRG